MTHVADRGSVIDQEAAPRLLRSMLLIRRFEEAMIELYRRNLIPGFIHPGIGEEAVHAGVCDLLSENDHLAATHRGHGQALARGVDPNSLMAEMLGRVDGTQGGRGGSLHVGDWSRGVLPASPLVGGGLGTMTGVALAHLYHEDGGVAVCFFGDGALNRGAFHEAANMAAAWRLPIVYACIDNGWAISVPRHASTAGRLTARAEAYGMPGEIVDGKDLAACRAAASEALARARAGDGPTLLIFDCPRGYGHEEGDAEEYRDRVDIERARALDPVPRACRDLVDQGLLTSERIAALEEEVDVVVRAAVEYGQASPLPDPESAFGKVFPSGLAVRHGTGV